jgi:nicotinamide-nucleotide adenylyltransferase
MDEDALSDLLGQPQNQPFAAYIHALPLSRAYRDVSSSRIRQHGAEHLQDVPEEVRHFMRETHAYDLPTHLENGTEVDYYEERVKALKALLQ